MDARSWSFNFFLKHWSNEMKFSFSHRRAFVGGITAALLALTAGMASAQADKPLRIGFSMARTGMLANATPSQMNTYELWREQTNAKGGMDVGGVRRKVEFVVFDDQSKPEQAVRIYEKLITDDKVDLLLAPWARPSTWRLRRYSKNSSSPWWVIPLHRWHCARSSPAISGSPPQRFLTASALS